VYVMLYLYEFRVNNPSTVNTVKQLLSGGVMGTVTYVACNPLKTNDLPIT